MSVFFLFLFNGISNFVNYLMPKPHLLKNSNGTNEPIVVAIREFILFGKILVQKCTEYNN